MTWCHTSISSSTVATPGRVAVLQFEEKIFYQAGNSLLRRVGDTNDLCVKSDIQR